jgi:hypothetical protein
MDRLNCVVFWLSCHHHVEVDLCPKGRLKCPVVLGFVANWPAKTQTFQADKLLRKPEKRETDVTAISGFAESANEQKPFRGSHS